MTTFPPAGTLMVVRNRGFVPRCIELLTVSPFGHAAVFYNDFGGIVEAEQEGARLGRVEEYAGDLMRVLTPPDPLKRAIIAHTAIGLCGTPYDDLDIADLGLEAIGLRWKWLNHLVSEHDHGMICSTLAAYCGEQAGYDWKHGRPNLAAVRPSDLALLPGMVPYTLD